MTPWRLVLLGNPVLEGPGKTVAPDRRTLAVLAYLALEGPTPRSKLAGLLWPDSSEDKARNNLSQNQRRLRQVTGEPLVLGGDLLQLSPILSVDAAQLKVHAFSGELERVAASSGELLSGLDYDDLPEFADWLYGEREALVGAALQALGTLSERAEAEGRFGDAVRYAERLLALDPVSESAHRSLMRLHYLAGDRPAALKAYHRCKEVLMRELEVEPLPETKALARSIDQGEVRAATQRLAPALPVEVLRPPVLVGREREWALMEAAWARGQAIYIRGEPGVGKSRLAQEFVASKGPGLYLPARPGYMDIPFAAAVGLARTRIAAAPQVRLPDWVSRELSRILPELHPDGAPLPLHQEGDRLRFFQAYLEMVRLTGAEFVATISDDAQYYDQATVELGSFMMSQARGPKDAKDIPRYVIVYRYGELPSSSQAIIDRIVASELAVMVDVAPLDAPATTSLLTSLRLKALGDEPSSRFADTVYRRTGGNALFILETLRNLIEIGRLGGDIPEHFPATSRVETIIRQRLARLSPTASRVVKAAAVLESDFDLELVGAVLDTEPLELLAVWEELERAQVFAGNRFSHDLLYETATQQISQPVRALLNRRSAEALEAREENPARVAKHWLASGDELRALPFLRRAAQRAAAESRTGDAERFFGQAVEVLNRAGDLEALAEVLAERQRTLHAPLS